MNTKEPHVSDLIRGKFSLVCGVALFMTVLSVHGQSMDFDCPRTGTILKFSSGTTTTAVGREGLYCKMQSSRSGAVDVYALMYLFTDALRKDPASTKYISPIEVERLWPLTVGKKHSGRATLSNGTYHLDYVVTSYEKLETAMGLEDVFVVESQENGVDNNYSAKARWWISPKYRYLLKYEFRDNRGRSLEQLVTEVFVPQQQ
jgi:hypothetical protein